MDIIIKKLSANDLQQAKKFIKYWKEEDGVDASNIPDDNYLQNLLAKASFHMYIALKDNVIIGGLTAYELSMYLEQTTEMFLYEIGVDEKYRKQGVGAKLIEALKQTCKWKGIKLIYVGTEINNEPARQLYKATGGELEEISWYTYELG
jgi:aminoglycoside 3-N-acetyltransferase I